MIRKIIIAAVSTGFLFFTSCSNDSSSSNNTTNNTGNNDDSVLSSLEKREMIDVTGGLFNQKAEQGTPDSFNHTVSNFKIGKYEVTYELWYKVRDWAETNGYKFANKGIEGSVTEGSYPNYTNIGAVPTAKKYEPVTSISWRDMIVWCNAYSEIEKLTPVYTYSATTLKDATNTTAADGASVNWSANGFRLPTEGEWQYAAAYINGTDWTPYNYASGAADATSNYPATSVVAITTNNATKTANVGSKAANALQIFDMSGNVYEACWDWKDEYPTSAQANYRGPASSPDTERVIKGGTWYESPGYSMIGARYSFEPQSADNEIGFRVARSN